MLSQLKANQGNQIVIELVNGSKIFGTLLEVNDKTLRMITDQGVATVFVTAVQIIWESQEVPLAETDMEEIAEKVRDLADKRYMCLGFNGFNCPQSYTCRPPHACNRFFCPGFFSSAPVPPPDEPCVGQFFGYKRTTDGKGDKETKE